MKNAKKYLPVFILFLAVGILLGIVLVQNSRHSAQGSGSRDEADVEELTASSGMAVGSAYGKLGLFQINNDKQLQFTDAKSYKTTLVCDKANCQHMPYEEDNETDCASDVHQFCAVIQNQSWIYLFENLDMGDVVLYRERLNGSSRRKVMDLEGTSGCVFLHIACRGDWMAISYTRDYRQDKKGNLVEKKEREAGVFLINLHDKSIICRKLNGQISGKDMYVSAVSLDEQYLYYTFSYYDEGYNADDMLKLSEKKQVSYQVNHSKGGYAVLSLSDAEEITSMEDAGIREAVLKGSELFYNNVYGDVGFMNLYPNSSGNEEDEDREFLVHEEPYEETDEGERKRIYCWYKPNAFSEDDFYYSYYDTEKDEAIYYRYDRGKGESQEIETDGQTAGVEYIAGDCYFVWKRLKPDNEESLIELTCMNKKDYLEGNTGGEESGHDAEQGDKGSVDDPKNTVIWGVNGDVMVTSDAKKEINSYLKKKGYSFQVDFCRVDLEGAQNGDSKKETSGTQADLVAEKYPEIDIFQVPMGQHYQNNAQEFIESGYYIPLTEFLKKDGRDLWKSYHPFQWEQVKYQDTVYTVPNSYLAYQGVYFVFNDKYVNSSERKMFDGTLNGVDKILSGVDGNVKSPVILDSNLSGFYYGTMLPVSQIYGLAVHEKSGEAKLWYEADSVKQWYKQLNSWYRKGLLSGDNAIIGDNMSEKQHQELEQIRENGDFAVDIGCGRVPHDLQKKGYTIYWAEHRLTLRCNLSTGVAKSSNCQKEAMEFLQLAYTDSYIATRMQYGSEGDGYHTEDGKLVGCSEQLIQKAELAKLYFGNALSAYPAAGTETSTITEDRKQMSKYYQENTILKSNLLGFVFHLSEYKDTVKNLMETEFEYEDIWKEEDFDHAYAALLKKLDTKQNRAYKKEINCQIEEQWEG